MKHVESAIQIEGIKFCRASSALRMAFHIQNEGQRSAQAGKRAKREGTLAGIPDLCIPLPDGKVVFIELKSKKGRLSKKQDQIINELVGFGHTVYVCRGLDELMATLQFLEDTHSV